jgi:hypothetical protein
MELDILNHDITKAWKNLSIVLDTIPGLIHQLIDSGGGELAIILEYRNKSEYSTGIEYNIPLYLREEELYGLVIKSLINILEIDKYHGEHPNERRELAGKHT